MIREMDFERFRKIHALRDELMDESDAFRAACELESFGSVQQQLSAGALSLVEDFPGEYASYLKPKLDTEVYPRWMAMTAGVIKSTFVSLLESACAPSDSRFELSMGPIKMPERIAVKVKEYAENQTGDSNWPFASKV